MENLIISCEATCDLNLELVNKYDIKLINMDFIIDGNVYSTIDNNVNSTHLYEKMKKGSKTSTSQVNIQNYEDFFASYIENYDILHIAFSSGLSDTYKSAVTASQNINAKNTKHKVYVIDSLCACSGQGMLAILAKEYSSKAKDIHKIIEYVDKVKRNLNHIFSVDNLKYLANGGRVKQSTALIGNLLNIKPVMCMNELGQLVVTNKVMSRKKALLSLIQKTKTNKTHETDLVFISHANCLEDAKFCAKAIEEEIKVTPIITDLGAVIGSHSGPGTIAIYYLGKGR